MTEQKQLPDVVDVVGVGADGWDGLSPRAREVIHSAGVLMGSARQLDLVPDPAGERITWPSPLLPALPGLFAAHHHRSICVLASGDPMSYGIGSTLARVLGPRRLRVLPHPSAVSLACARMGWPAQDTQVVSLVGRPVELLHPHVHPERTVLVLSSDETTPGEVATLLTNRGYGASELTVLQNLGHEREQRLVSTAAEWDDRNVDPLNVVAVRCRADRPAGPLPRVPGLPDDAFVHDGQLTKRDVRIATLARLAPAPGQLLWDVGAGSGSVGVEWMRTDSSCRAIAIESRADRAARVGENARSLGVPGLRLVTDAAPGALEDLETPDAVFIGGGVTTPGVLETCWHALPPGGRLVVNAVTMESEVVVADWYGRLGGELVRIGVEQASPVGGYTGWRPAMRVTQWAVIKP